MASPDILGPAAPHALPANTTPVLSNCSPAFPIKRVLVTEMHVVVGVVVVAAVVAVVQTSEQELRLKSSCMRGGRGVR